MSRLIEEDVSNPVNPIHSVHGWRSPARGGPPLINLLIHHSVYELIMELTEASLPNETGGFLLGHVGFDPDHGSWYNEIDEAIPISPADARPTHFTFTWKDVDRVRTHREQAGKALIGWYHSHPGLGIFLSETDLEKTHAQLFNEPFQVALVYDPIRGRAGYFYREASGTVDAGTADWREFDLRREPVSPNAQIEADQVGEATS